MRLLLPFLVLLLATVTSCLKILIYNPKFSFSHANFMNQLASTLQEAGHNVTSVLTFSTSPVKDNSPKNIRVIRVDTNEFLSDTVKEGMNALRAPDHWDRSWRTPAYNPRSITRNLPLLAYMFTASATDLLNRTSLLDELKAEKFDLGVAELFDFTAFALFHAINLTNMVGAHSTGIFEGTARAMGVPILPIYVPGSQSITGDSGSYYDRIMNGVFTYYSEEFQLFSAGITQKVMNDQFGKNAPEIWEQVSNLPLVVTNSEPLLDFPKPTLHNIVDLGGLGRTEAHPLTQEWLDKLAIRSKNVLISFGSIAPSTTMPMEMRRNIARQLKSFPDVTFIWKYEDVIDEFSKELPENVMLTAWTPQNDLLASGKISLFVTHGGAGSIYETSSSAVPIICSPIFGDQPRNAKMAERLGMGIVVDKIDLMSGDKLQNAIKQIFEDPSYLEGVIRVQHLLKIRPFTPQEKLVRHIEMAYYVGKTKGPSLNPEGRHMSYITFFNIDLAVIFVSLMVVSIFLVSKIVLRVVSIFASLKTSEVKSKRA